jgi:hypothetical protein
LRTNANHQLEIAPIDEKEALEELQKAVATYDKHERSLMPWVWGVLAVLLAIGIAAVFGVRK